MAAKTGRFQGLEERDPVDAGAFHGDCLDVVFFQPGGDCLQVGGVDAEGAHQLGVRFSRYADQDFAGADVHAGGAITITNSTFSDNSAASGGGISNAGTMLVAGSTFSANSATDRGGISNGGTPVLINSTFAGNNASTYGGGSLNGGTLTIVNSAFSGNSATNGGGGIRNTGTVAVYNTFIANSTAGGNCSGPITNGGNNNDSGTTCGWGTGNGSMSDTDPQLGILTDNGDPTWTFALLEGSSATDQRGYLRPVDGDNNGSALHDLGAFEYPRALVYLPLILKGP